MRVCVGVWVSVSVVSRGEKRAISLYHLMQADSEGTETAMRLTALTFSLCLTRRHTHPQPPHSYNKLLSSPHPNRAPSPLLISPLSPHLSSSSPRSSSLPLHCFLVTSPLSFNVLVIVSSPFQPPLLHLHLLSLPPNLKIL